MIGAIVGFAARSALMSSPVGAFLKGGWALLARIPKPVWEALAVLGYVLALFALHQHYAKAAIKAADQAGYDRARHEDDAALERLRAKARTVTANGVNIAQETRTSNEAANLNIHADAGSIRLRGPGAAAASCRQLGNPTVPAAGGQPGASGDQLPDAARNPVPAADGQPNLATVPFDWLVGRAEQADLDRAEVLSWRDWYQRQAKAWEALQSGDQPSSK